MPLQAGSAFELFTDSLLQGVLIHICVFHPFYKGNQLLSLIAHLLLRTKRPIQNEVGYKRKEFAPRGANSLILESTSIV